MVNPESYLFWEFLSEKERQLVQQSIVISKLKNSPSPEIIRAIAQSNNETLQLILLDYACHLLPEDVCIYLMSNAGIGIQLAMANAYNISELVAEKIATKGCLAAREALASRADLSDKVCRILESDEDESVRKAIQNRKELLIDFVTAFWSATEEGEIVKGTLKE